jgi:hypothetical protein
MLTALCRKYLGVPEACFLRPDRGSLRGCLAPTIADVADIDPTLVRAWGYIAHPPNQERGPMRTP